MGWGLAMQKGFLQSKRGTLSSRGYLAMGEVALYCEGILKCMGGLAMWGCSCNEGSIL